MRICSVDGCEDRHSAHGLCAKHNEKRRRDTFSGLCSFEGCVAKVGDLKSGLCGGHRQQMRRGEELRAINRILICEICLKEYPRGRGGGGPRRWCPDHRTLGKRLKTHNMDIVRITDMMLDQDFKCLICKDELGLNVELAIDHDHKCCDYPNGRSCGRCVRGLLCRHCNAAFGQMREDPKRIHQLWLYATACQSVPLSHIA